jgi:hypothetical protein
MSTENTGVQDGEIFTAPPHLCINPRLRKGYVATKAGMVEAESGILATINPDIRVPVAELFVDD